MKKKKKFISWELWNGEKDGKNWDENYEAARSSCCLIAIYFEWV